MAGNFWDNLLDVAPAAIAFGASDGSKDRASAQEAGSRAQINDFISNWGGPMKVPGGDSGGSNQWGSGFTPVTTVAGSRPEFGYNGTGPVYQHKPEPVSNGGWGFFDEKAYLAANPDVAAAVKAGAFSAAQHYQQYGQAEGRSPTGQAEVYQHKPLAVNPASGGDMRLMDARVLPDGRVVGRDDPAFFGGVDRQKPEAVYQRKDGSPSGAQPNWASGAGYATNINAPVGTGAYYGQVGDAWAAYRAGSGVNPVTGKTKAEEGDSWMSLNNYMMQPDIFMNYAVNAGGKGVRPEDYALAHADMSIASGDTGRGGILSTGQNVFDRFLGRAGGSSQDVFTGQLLDAKQGIRLSGDSAERYKRMFGQAAGNVGPFAGLEYQEDRNKLLPALRAAFQSIGQGAPQGGGSPSAPGGATRPSAGGTAGAPSGAAAPTGTQAAAFLNQAGQGDFYNRQIPVKNYSTDGVDDRASQIYARLAGGVDRANAVAASQGFAQSLRNGMGNSTAAAATSDDLTRKFSDVYSKLAEDAAKGALSENQSNYASYLSGTNQAINQNLGVGQLNNAMNTAIMNNDTARLNAALSANTSLQNSILSNQTNRGNAALQAMLTLYGADRVSLANAQNARGGALNNLLANPALMNLGQSAASALTNLLRGNSNPSQGDILSIISNDPTLSPSDRASMLDIFGNNYTGNPYDESVFDWGGVDLSGSQPDPTDWFYTN